MIPLICKIKVITIVFNIFAKISLSRLQSLNHPSSIMAISILKTINYNFQKSVSFWLIKSSLRKFKILKYLLIINKSAKVITFLYCQ